MSRLEQHVLQAAYWRYCACVPEFETFETHPVRFMYHVQRAHWFVLDYTPLPSVGHNPQTFARLLRRKTPLRSIPEENWNAAFDEWNHHRKVVPRAAVVLISHHGNIACTKDYRGTVILPGGKMGSPEEEPMVTASREVIEELGLYLGDLLQEAIQVKTQVVGTECTFFVLAGIDEHIELGALTRGEVASINWIPVKTLLKKSAPQFAAKQIIQLKKASPHIFDGLLSQQ